MKTTNNPKVTVLMSVYNGARYLREAIDSILGQTFEDFEFIIINDGSTDGTEKILDLYDDSRLVLIHQDNMGLTKSLNRGLDMACGEYIARMDSDDISLSKRLERQMAYMDANPDVGVCGAWVKIFGEAEGDVWQYPVDHDKIKCMLLFNCSLAHSSVVMRKGLLERYGLRYDENLKTAQDYELWIRCAEHLHLANLDEILVLHRLHPHQVGIRLSESQMESTDRVRMIQLQKLCILPDEQEFEIHRRLAVYDFKSDRDFVEAAHRWLLKLSEANRKIGRYHRQTFEWILGERWFNVCMSATTLGAWTWKTFQSSPLIEAARLSMSQRIIFSVKCGLGSIWPI